MELKLASKRSLSKMKGEGHFNAWLIVRMVHGSQLVITQIANQKSLFGRLAKWKKMEEFIHKSINYAATDMGSNH